ncbi:hypothetical protein OGH69_05565 [Flavobacterium sp. MFBS3-15]|uniref:hypothetical protein n=1 Tax=Flavobacterium sp. MFBS3-15 TaxID=2989816 RepID=UPI002236334C|nr:hypothetical protein [Flavobacterium sp. MFBS3-15]MCW4468424.1 hypothetical protein [Flavobacterium sp. MFBS3-15]
MKAGNNTFKIYTPVKKFYPKGNLVGYLASFFGILGILSCIISRITQSDIALIIGLVSTTCMLLIFIGCIPLAISATFRYQTLPGDLNGKVTFNIDDITVNDKLFELDKISKITFSLVDYKGLYIGRRGGLDGRKSQGIENTFSLYINDNEITYQFQLLYKGQIKEIREQLIQYHLAGKLHFLHLTDLLEITKYEEIQEFKQQLPTGLK